MCLNIYKNDPLNKLFINEYCFSIICATQWRFFAMSFLILKGKTGYGLFPASCSVLSAASRRPALWLSLTWHSASTEGNTHREEDSAPIFR